MDFIRHKIRTNTSPFVTYFYYLMSLHITLKDCIPDSFVDVVNLNTWSTLMIIEAKFATLSSLNFVHASCVQKFSQQIIKTKVFILWIFLDLWYNMFIGFLPGMLWCKGVLRLFRIMYIIIYILYQYVHITNV